jgi:hypothetical protein
MTRRYRRHPELRLTALEGEGVALHLGTRRYYTVNESGLDLLEALASPKTLEELAGVLTTKYEVTDAQAADTARAFVERGVKAGVLLVEEQP